MTYREQDKVESTEGSQSCKLSWMDTPQSPGTDVILRWTAACSNRGIYSQTQRVRPLLREHKALGVMRRKWLNIEFPSLEIFSANTNPWNPSGWTCFVQGFNRTLSFQPQVPSVFHSNTISLIKREAPSAIISVKLPKGKKAHCVHRSQGKFRTLLDFAGD